MGSIIALSGVVFALVVGSYGFIVALLVTLVVCAVLGAFTGAIVAYLKIDSFLTSLAMMIVIRGVALVLSDAKPIVVSDSTTLIIGSYTLGAIPILTLLFIAIVFISEYVLKHTVFGRNLYAIGGNAEMAKSIGLNVKLYKFLVFVIFGILACIGGIFLMARMNTGTPIVGEDAPLATIPMAIVGGAALSGGKGGALKTLSGVVFMSLIFNIMQIFGISLDIQTFTRGAILLGVIIWDRYNANKNKKV